MPLIVIHLDKDYFQSVTTGFFTAVKKFCSAYISTINVCYFSHRDTRFLMSLKTWQEMF